MPKPILSLLLVVMALLAPAMLLHAEPPSRLESLRSFHKRAEQGGTFDIVFFGGSLTYGANASDPLTTSYRGRMMSYLLKKYPKANITFHDAAIGGSGSNLGIFRLERDVMAFKPDLVFLDFTVNDGEDKDVPTLAAYERIVRKVIGSGAALVPAMFCFKYHMTDLEAPLPKGHEVHLKLLQAYNLPVANVFLGIQQTIKSGKATREDIWSIGKDGAHPGDEGYRYFFEFVKDTYEAAIKDDAPVQTLPEKAVYQELYPNVYRQILVNTTLPEGWKREITRRTSMWFDGLSSRWMTDVAAASIVDGKAPAPLEIKFRGSMVGLFGERDGISLSFNAFVDGKPVLTPGNVKQKIEPSPIWKVNSANMSVAKAGQGNLFSWIVLAKDLPDGEHTLRIEPITTGEGIDPKGQLRIESVCSGSKQ
ncbi:MAG: SGNH/GDSL hydrolase family protein [Candidatus Methylacidiphilales bacterium]|nr:SGNH/GDSL hydrolase family protein [Candidatus Methylacidiphilales bacterium]